MRLFLVSARPGLCLPLVGLLTLGLACSEGHRPRPARISVPDVPTHLRVRLPDGSVRGVGIEDYVRAAIISEFAPESGDPSLVERMLEVQAVVARTYAIANAGRHRREGFDLCSNIHCQLYEPSRLRTSSWAKAAAEATTKTSGMILWYRSGPARTVFHADCGGRTSAAADVWRGELRPYLAAVVDDGPASLAHSTWRFDVETVAITRALNKERLTRIGKELKGIDVVERDGSGRAERVALRGTTHIAVVRGEELRTILTRAFGPKSMRSTNFQVERSGRQFIFSGHGYGHGVGLCQAGAYAWLKAGANPEDVLARYYPGTKLLTVR